MTVKLNDDGTHSVKDESFFGAITTGTMNAIGLGDNDVVGLTLYDVRILLLSWILITVILTSMYVRRRLAANPAARPFLKVFF